MKASTYTLAFAAIVGLTTASNFGTSCQNIHLSGNAQLRANCLNLDKQYVATFVNLDTCIANDNGTLVFSSSGDFTATCSNSHLTCSSTHVHLIADCDGNGNGQVITASINLNTDVTNNNGKLQC